MWKINDNDKLCYFDITFQNEKRFLGFLNKDELNKITFNIHEKNT